MREIGIEEMRSRLVEMVVDIDKVCRENGINLYMSGGTLLGAVRHKGFIPWDDDIDMYLSRPDYEKLIEIMKERNKNSRYKFLAHEIDDKYLYPFAKYIDTKTLLIEKGGYAGVEIGLFVDIFPIDGLGQSVEEAKKQMKRVNPYILMNLSLLVKPWRKEVPFLKNAAIAVLRLIAKIYGANRIHEKMVKIVKEVPYETSKYVGEFIDEIGDKRIMLKEDMYHGYVELDFENVKLKAPVNWDKFLTQFYGDYMKLPPVEKRVMTHGYELYDKEEQ